jgi:lipoate-protein ligase A
MRTCFETPGEGELVAQGAKLVGSAQWRENGALLQHGSILVDDDQSSLPNFSAADVAANGSIPAPATLHSLLGRAPDPDEVAQVMFEAVRALEDAEATEMTEGDVRADALERVPNFLDEDWTWRR